MELTTLRRQDVILSEDKLEAFLLRCALKGFTSSEIFQETAIILEDNGNITIEFARDGCIPQFEIFAPHEWEPGPKTSLKMQGMFARVRPTPTKAEVYDFFSGQRINLNKQEERFGEQLRQKIEELEQNTF